MTNLSKELCEVCGIKPLYRIEGIEVLQSRTALQLIQLARKNSGYKDIDAVLVYPDFEQPENFVKLFALPIKIESNEPTETIIHILSMRFHIFDVEDFLNALYKYLIGYNDYGAQIIEAIRETEWVYE